jgi:hypothetical protein
MSEKLLNTLEDCKWLRETHLEGWALTNFRSFVIQGNEDCPDKVTLYERTDPDMGEEIVSVFVADENGDLKLDRWNPILGKPSKTG